MDSTVLILTIVVISVIVLVNLLVYGTKMRAASVLKHVDDLLKKTGEKVGLKDTSANFFGLKSLGGGQIRGNGILVLTDKNVRFFRYFPKKEITIPIQSIKNIDSTNAYLGKSVFAPLLKIEYEGDETAFWVEDLQEWTDALKESAMGRV